MFGYFSAILYICLIAIWSLDTFFKTNEESSYNDNNEVRNNQQNVRSTVQFSARRSSNKAEEPRAMPRSNSSHRIEARQGEEEVIEHRPTTSKYKAPKASAIQNTHGQISEEI